MATTQRGIYYPNDYSVVADIPKDMKDMAESVDEALGALDDDKVDKVAGKGLSTEDFTTEAKNKLAGLENYDDTELSERLDDAEQDIYNIGDEQTIQNAAISANTAHISENLSEINKIKEELVDTKEQLADLQKNAKKSQTELFEETELSNSADSRIYSLDAFQGNTVQNQYEGRNLYNDSSIAQQYTKDANGYYSGQVTQFINYLNSHRPSITYKENTQYTFQWKGYASSNGYPRAIFHYTDGTQTEGASILPTEAIYSMTSTVGKTVSSLTFTYGSGSPTMYVKAIQLEEGSTATDYEPYVGGTASPNPSYPQEIHNCGENVNLLNIYANYITREQVTYNNIVINNETVSFTVSGNRAGYLGWVIPVEIGKTYPLSFGAKNSNTHIYIAELDEIPTSITTYGNEKNNGDVITATKQYLGIWVQGSPGNLSVSKLKLEQDTEASPYSEYGCGSINEKIRNKNLCSSVSRSGNNANLNFNLNKNDLQRTFTVSFTTNESLNGNSLYLVLDGVQKYINYITASANTKATITTTLSETQWNALQNATSCNLRVYKAGANFIRPTDAQIENGSTATDYEPYTYQILPFPLAEGQVMAEGDYLADDGIHHVMGHTTLTGTTITINDAKTNGAYRCTQALPGNLDGKTLTLTESVTDATIEYELAEEVIEPYTEEQQTAYEALKKARTYKDKTYWNSLDTVPSKKQITYYVDRESYDRSIETRLEVLESEV